MKPKRNLFLLTLTAALMAWMPLRSAANVVGYVNLTFNAGDTLFENPLLAPDDHLSVLIPLAPDGTTVSLWNPGAHAYQPSVVFDAGLGKWLNPVTGNPADLLLDPGTGARMHTGTAFPSAVTFVGNALNHDGSGFNDLNNPNPPPFPGPPGLYLFGDKCPVDNTGTNIFLHIIGRNPLPGEQFSTLTDTFTYQANGTWLKNGIAASDPTLAVGGAGFFNLLAVPEPSVGALGVLGAVLFARFRRREA